MGSMHDQLSHSATMIHIVSITQTSTAKALLTSTMSSAAAQENAV